VESWFDISPSETDPVRTWADRLWALCWKRPITAISAIIAMPIVFGFALGAGFVSILWGVFG